MKISTVTGLFKLFSGEESTVKYEPLIGLAIAETEKMLLPDADRDDIRLDFLSAAIANNRLQQINSAHDRTRATYAGKIISVNEDSSLTSSERLLKSYLELCSDLIAPQIFTFTAV